MLRSLFSGISGLSNHMTMLDVVGSNIANINTVGYKSSRVTFREMLTQTIRGATRPVSGVTGGTNPVQIGLGTVIQSIDPTFSQGNLQNTGKITDLAIEGDGFFILGDGASRYYTRAGSFTFDGLGQLVSTGTGYTVMGVMAEDDGSIDYGRPIEALRLGNDLVTPAQATTSLVLAGNIDADANALGTITHSHSFLIAAGGANVLSGLTDSTGTNLGVTAGDDVTVQVDVGGTTYSGTYTTTATSTTADLVAFMNTVTPANASFSITANGAIQVTASGGQAIDRISASIPGGTSFDNAMFPSGTIPPAGSALSDELRAPATASDLLDNLYNATGTKLAFVPGDDFRVDGTVGGVNVMQTLTYNAGVTTLGDLANTIQTVFGVTNATGVLIDNTGQIEVNGDPGLNSEITEISVSTVGAPNTPFTTNLAFSEVQEARDAITWRTTATLFDSLGRDFRVAVSYTKRTGTNLWDWTVTPPSGVTVIQGGSGTVGFSANGRLSSFDFTDGSNGILMDPGNGSEIMQVALDPGEFGGLEGLLQYRGPSTATAKDFDGHGAGTLQGITINNDGVLIGQFTNGINRSLAQVAMAEFNNSSGLKRLGNNVYGTSSNTGPESITYVGANASGSIVPGSLEMSNVDLSTEFTQMIIAQRGFQANARVITTGDEMLSELVTLKR
jgi:flagellar hook protein FlgE